jgi:O-antigen ligase
MKLRIGLACFFVLLLSCAFIAKAYGACIFMSAALFLYLVNRRWNDFTPFLLLLLIPVDRRLPLISLQLEEIRLIKYGLTFVIMLLWMFRQKRLAFPRDNRTSLAFWISAFCLITTVAALRSPNLELGLKGLLPVYTGLGAFVIFYNYLQSKGRIEYSLYLLLGINAIISGISVLQTLIIRYNVFTFLENLILPPRQRTESKMGEIEAFQEVIRVNGTFVHPNYFGQFLIFMFFLAVILLLWKGLRSWQRLGVGAVMGLSLIGLYNSNCRSAILGTVIGGAVVFFLASRKWFTIAAVAGTLLIASFSQTPYFEGVLGKHFRLREGVSYRDVIWSQSMELIRQHPWLGYGLNAYPVVYQSDMGLPLGNSYENYDAYLIEIELFGYILDIMPGMHPHNSWFAWIFEIGMVAVFFIGSFFLYYGIKSALLLRRYATVDQLGRPALIGCIGMFCALLFDGVFQDSMFYKTYFGSVLLSYVAALITILYERATPQHAPNV